MQRIKNTATWVLALALTGPGLGWAGEVTLPFRLVTQEIGSADFDAPEGIGRVVSASQNVGTAVFEDGRIAHKTFVTYGDSGADSGGFTGYSAYVFENGDRLNLKFVGGWSSEGLGGDYEVLSGTGAFAGATGTGRFDAVGAAWEGATLYNGQFTLDLPGS